MASFFYTNPAPTPATSSKTVQKVNLSSAYEKQAEGYKRKDASKEELLSERLLYKCLIKTFGDLGENKLKLFKINYAPVDTNKGIVNIVTSQGLSNYFISISKHILENGIDGNNNKLVIQNFELLMDIIEIKKIFLDNLKSIKDYSKCPEDVKNDDQILISNFLLGFEETIKEHSNSKPEYEKVIEHVVYDFIGILYDFLEKSSLYLTGDYKGKNKSSSKKTTKKKEDEKKEEDMDIVEFINFSYKDFNIREKEKTELDSVYKDYMLQPREIAKVLSLAVYRLTQSQRTAMKIPDLTISKDRKFAYLSPVNLYVWVDAMASYVLDQYRKKNIKENLKDYIYNTFELKNLIVNVNEINQKKTFNVNIEDLHDHDIRGFAKGLITIAGDPRINFGIKQLAGDIISIIFDKKIGYFEKYLEEQKKIEEEKERLRLSEIESKKNREIEAKKLADEAELYRKGKEKREQEERIQLEKEKKEKEEQERIKLEKIKKEKDEKEVEEHLETVTELNEEEKKIQILKIF